uniref:Uncharacterized protein n=1 Tax=Steinernema glaseri TaxID=37863 RepID=A0A1I7Z208_9BILA
MERRTHTRPTAAQAARPNPFCTSDELLKNGPEEQWPRHVVTVPPARLSPGHLAQLYNLSSVAGGPTHLLLNPRHRFTTASNIYLAARPLPLQHHVLSRFLPSLARSRDSALGDVARRRRLHGRRRLPCHQHHRRRCRRDPPKARGGQAGS